METQKKGIENNEQDKKKGPKDPGLFSILKPYLWIVLLLVVLTLVANGLNLVIPKLVSKAIDAFSSGTFVLHSFVLQFSIISIIIFIFVYLQNIVQTYASERVARDLRTQLSAKISVQSHAFIEKATPEKLLTNLTSDVDAIKTFVAQGISTMVSSIFLIIGASVLLLITNWKLALVVLAVVPIIGFSFFIIFGKVSKLFKRSQESIDWLNKVINESVLGASLIRLVNSQTYEYEKFLAANTEAKTIGLSILKLFAGLIPIITFFTNMAILAILSLGGHFVISGSMTLGDFSAFQGYLLILIFPIIILGFMSTVIGQASASYGRIKVILDAAPKKEDGKVVKKLDGDIEVKNLTLTLGEKSVLDNVSFSASRGTRTAIIGPTAAGKTQLLYTLTGLVEPTSGAIFYDGKDIKEYNPENLHEQVGFVFQDSILFNLSIRENIAFSNAVKDESLQKAIATAELSDFINTLPEGLDTIVSERGTTLSGGQKQRIMLARALALNPQILLLDDFTSRVDTGTEKKILNNVFKNYPGITLISVTQKISPVEDYDQIIVLMEGTLIGKGTNKELMETSPEYVQIYNSQESTNRYELQA